MKPLPRPSMSKARRARIWERDGGVCYLCAVKVALGEDWDVEHRVPWALSFDDSDENLAVAHKAGCHAEKTKGDVKRIAKAKRQAGETGQQKRRREKGGSIPSRPFQKGPKRAWPKRKMR